MQDYVTSPIVSGRTTIVCTLLNKLVLMQTEASANRISQQLLVEDPESRLLDMERALQSKERHIEDLTQELASSHASQLYGHGAAPDHDLNSHSRLNCPCCNPSSGTFSAAVQVRCTHAGTPCSTCGSPQVDLGGFSTGDTQHAVADAHFPLHSPDGLKEQLIDHWRAGVSVAQRTLAQLREQHECPSAEEIAMAVSKAQETASALNACASMHEFGFSFDFMRDGIPAQAGTVAVDALSQALRAAHMHVLHSSKLYNGESLHKLQGAWSAMRYACRMLSDQLEGEAGTRMQNITAWLLYSSHDVYTSQSVCPQNPVACIQAPWIPQPRSQFQLTWML